MKEAEELPLRGQEGGGCAAERQASCPSAGTEMQLVKQNEAARKGGGGGLTAPRFFGSWRLPRVFLERCVGLGQTTAVS